MAAFLRTPALLLVLLTVSCSRGGSPDTTPDPDSGYQPRARIENRPSTWTSTPAEGRVATRLDKTIKRELELSGDAELRRALHLSLDMYDALRRAG